MSGLSDQQRFNRASIANIIGNAVKIIVEGAVGLLFGSIALLADAAHSIADLVASFVVYIWGESRFKDPDETHPHGHARIEPLTALFVGAVIVLLGVNFLYESVTGLAYGVDVTFHPLLVVGILIAMLDMYFIYWYTSRMNEEVGAPALKALAVDCLNDLYTSVAALLGVLGVALGYPILDAAAGALVSVLVIYQGVKIAKENIEYLSGKAASTEQQQMIKETLQNNPEVYDVHDLVVFYEGPSLEVEAHVEVPHNLSFQQAHDLETKLRNQTIDLDDVSDAHIHLDPIDMKDDSEEVQRPIDD